MTSKEWISGLAASILLAFGGCLQTGCSALHGELGWMNRNESQARWVEQRASGQATTEFVHNDHSEMVLAMAGEEAHAQFTGATDPALFELKERLAELQAESKAAVSVVAQLFAQLGEMRMDNDKAAEDNSEQLDEIQEQAADTAKFVDGTVKTTGGLTGLAGLVMGGRALFRSGRNGNGTPPTSGTPGA